MLLSSTAADPVEFLLMFDIFWLSVTKLPGSFSSSSKLLLCLNASRRHKKPVAMVQVLKVTSLCFCFHSFFFLFLSGPKSNVGAALTQISRTMHWRKNRVTVSHYYFFGLLPRMDQKEEDKAPRSNPNYAFIPICIF